MLKNHERFYSSNGKRLLLIAEDEGVNRELLRFILEDHYDLLFAENGRDALDLMREHAQTLSLVLLDLMMPVMDGFDLMEQTRQDQTLRRIPIIVLTSEKAAEVKSLRLGAQDFIMKPYDLPEVILARIQRTIELSEDKNILLTTERDELTGLLHSGFFYRFVDQFDLHHPGMSMDAISVNVNRFRMINELYGRTQGDAILQKLGARLMEVVRRVGGIAGRKGGDEFLLYTPHGVDPNDILGILLAQLDEENRMGKIRIRLGVYPDCDGSLEVERRFDRAKQAADTLRNNYSRFIALYDNSLHDKELLAEQLIEDVDEALSERQFSVFYQPKFNVTGEKPYLASAEALIRWKHPNLGMISPGIFIPLFEQNGLIQKLDRYVWKEAARQVRAWREQFGITIPVSVNVSRIDMYATDFVPFVIELIESNGLQPKDLCLEITESAYTEDSRQLIETVCALRARGFIVEMDDFGSGYSSLNMLSTLPIDALKLDMNFVRNMDSDQKNVRMLELMIDIARYLDVLVIAEGVETEQQMLTLKALGCDLIQGYYFSRPLTPRDFEDLIKERIASC